MQKTITFQAINNRIQFRCPCCQAKRNMSIPPQTRRRTIRCHKCGESVRCNINRRTSRRSSQTGRVVVINGRGKETEVLLHDISEGGAAFDLPLGNVRVTGLATGSQLKFKCGWNPRLFGSSQFKVKNIHGRRVGVQRM